jgi:hypothetical protein
MGYPVLDLGVFVLDLDLVDCGGGGGGGRQGAGFRVQELEKSRKQEAGTARRQGSGFRVQERLVKSPSFPRKRESMLAPD